METIRVLLVEDNPVDALCFKEALDGTKGTKFAITHVETLGDARRWLVEKGFDAVVVDLGLSYRY